MPGTQEAQADALARLTTPLADDTNRDPESDSAKHQLKPRCQRLAGVGHWLPGWLLAAPLAPRDHIPRPTLGPHTAALPLSSRYLALSSLTPDGHRLTATCGHLPSPA